MRMKRVLKCMISGIGAGVPRNNCKDAIPQFCVGMTFRGIYLFPKDDLDRAGAICLHVLGKVFPG
jgi:hypothetical protein